jgi:hypothetical protein
MTWKRVPRDGFHRKFSMKGRPESGIAAGTTTNGNSTRTA